MKKIIDFEVVQEPWTIIKLADGAVVKLRLIVSQVFEVDSPVPGKKNYLAMSSNVMAIVPPLGAENDELLPGTKTTSTTVM